MLNCSKFIWAENGMRRRVKWLRLVESQLHCARLLNMLSALISGVPEPHSWWFAHSPALQLWWYAWDADNGAPSLQVNAGGRLASLQSGTHGQELELQCNHSEGPWYLAFQKTFLLDLGLIVHYPYHRLCHELMLFRIDFLKFLLMLILVLKKALVTPMIQLSAWQQLDVDSS